MGRYKKPKKDLRINKCTKSIDLITRGKIIGAYDHGGKPNVIAEEYNISYRSVMRMLQKHKQGKSLTIGKGTGRPPLIDKRAGRRLARMIEKDSFVTSYEMQNELGNIASARTIRDYLNKYTQYSSRLAARKPFLTEANIKKRLQWALDHLDWTNEQWMEVMWSDESPYTLRYRGMRRCWRKKGERYLPKNTIGTVKHDTKINVWGCFSGKGVGNLHLIDGIMNAKQYIKILSSNLFQSAKMCFDRDDTDWIFQQDNDPKHTARATDDWLEQKGVNRMEWPPQSPDLNPIENLWSILDRNLMNRKVNSEEELYNALLDGWNNLSDDIITNLINSMPRRCEEVIKVKGYMTKY